MKLAIKSLCTSLLVAGIVASMTSANAAPNAPTAPTPSAQQPAGANPFEPKNGTAPKSATPPPPGAAPMAPPPPPPPPPPPGQPPVPGQPPAPGQPGAAGPKLIGTINGISVTRYPGTYQITPAPKHPRGVN